MTRLLTSLWVLALLLPGLAYAPAAAQPGTPQATPPDSPRSVLLDDFESYQAGGLPSRWQYIDSRQQPVPVTPKVMSKDEYFVVLSEGGNKFVRAVTLGRAHRLILPNGKGYAWDLNRHPQLAWDWRANRLPRGAREDVEKKNDTGGAIYVTFSRDWLGRPTSIKYTYSSTLPVGTVVSYGKLKVIVVASGLNGLGKWQHVQRNVAEDYRKLFGGNPPARPILIMMWSDSDSVSDAAEVDFDNLRLLPAGT